jgi:hypothetical protein
MEQVAQAAPLCDKVSRQSVNQSIITSNILLLRPNNPLHLPPDARPTSPGAGSVLESESLSELVVVNLDCLLVAVQDGAEEHAQLALGERGEGARGGGGFGFGSHGFLWWWRECEGGWECDGKGVAWEWERMCGRESMRECLGLVGLF